MQLSKVIFLTFSLIFLIELKINAQDWSSLASKVLKSTVYIEAGGRASGSGFRISDDLIVTNWHVIEGNSRAIRISNINSKNSYYVKLLRYDIKNDLAILKISNSHKKYFKDKLKLNLSLPNIGSKVFACGNPHGLQGTFSDGIVSAIQSPGTSDLPANFIQITAPIAPGSSGGPLVNIKGEVIGVNTMVIDDVGSIGFAVPSKYIKNLIPSSSTYNDFVMEGDNSISKKNNNFNERTDNDYDFSKPDNSNVLVNFILVFSILGVLFLFFYLKNENKLPTSSYQQRRARISRS